METHQSTVDRTFQPKVASSLKQYKCIYHSLSALQTITVCVIFALFVYLYFCRLKVETTRHFIVLLVSHFTLIIQG